MAATGALTTTAAVAGAVGLSGGEPAVSTPAAAPVAAPGANGSGPNGSGPNGSGPNGSGPNGSGPNGSGLDDPDRRDDPRADRSARRLLLGVTLSGASPGTSTSAPAGESADPDSDSDPNPDSDSDSDDSDPDADPADASPEPSAKPGKRPQHHEVTRRGRGAQTGRAHQSGPARSAKRVSESCGASFYDEGQTTASGERFNPGALTTAHRTLRMGTRIRVINARTGDSVVVRVNDRGPYSEGRCLDLSRRAFLQIGSISAGVIRVRYQVL